MCVKLRQKKKKKKVTDSFLNGPLINDPKHSLTGHI